MTEKYVSLALVLGKSQTSHKFICLLLHLIYNKSELLCNYNNYNKEYMIVFAHLENLQGTYSHLQPACSLKPKELSFIKSGYVLD